LYVLNNSVIFSGKPIGSEEFLNRMYLCFTKVLRKICPFDSIAEVVRLS
jgi:hypothetical protein